MAGSTNVDRSTIKRLYFILFRKFVSQHTWRYPPVQFRKYWYHVKFVILQGARLLARALALVRLVKVVDQLSTFRTYITMGDFLIDCISSRRPCFVYEL